MVSKHNRALGFLFIFALLIVGILLSRSGILSESPAPSLAGMGQVVVGDGRVPLPVSNSHNSASSLLGGAGACLELPLPISTDQQQHVYDGESLMGQLQTGLGPATVKDNWVNWHFHGADGQERRLRLEVVTGDQGEMQRQLKLYAVDKSGMPIPLELQGLPALNPSDDDIKKFLQDNAVFHNEKAQTAEFISHGDSGDSAEWIEIEGQLQSFVIRHRNNVYQCTNLLAKDGGRGATDAVPDCSCTH